jgi:hypothetical protein
MALPHRPSLGGFVIALDRDAIVLTSDPEDIARWGGTGDASRRLLTVEAAELSRFYEPVVATFGTP